MKLPDRIKIFEMRALDIRRTQASEESRVAACAWLAEMTRRAEEAGIRHEANDAPVSYICRYMGVEVRDFRNMLREKCGYAAH